MIDKRDGTGGDAREDSPQRRATAADVIRETLWTSRHAVLLFDSVADRLGDFAYVDTANEGTRRLLFRRDAPGSDLIVPWPLLVLDTRSRGQNVYFDLRTGEEYVPPTVRPGEAPKLRGIGPGRIEIHDGSEHVGVAYGDDGRWLECDQSDKRSLAGAFAAIQRASANPVELLAEYVSGLDVSRHGVGRVVMPDPLPGGLQSLWIRGLHVAREALFDDRLPDPGWVVVDGFAAAVLAFGRTRDEALAAFRAEVERVRPVPPPPAPKLDPTDLPVGAAGLPGQWITGPDYEVSWPDPTPESTPAVLIRLEPCPYRPKPWGQWIRLLGRRGETVHALRRCDRNGFILVGERLALDLDLDTIDEQLGAAFVPDISPRTQEQEALFGAMPPSTFRSTSYRFLDDKTGRRLPLPAFAGGREGPQFHARDLDGDELRAHVLRHRWLSPP